MTESPFDVLVLGGGAGGVPAALRAAQLGGRVAIVEQNAFGGMCMNRGCIPFGNAMVASEFMGGVPLGRELGLSCPPIHGDYAALMKRQDELIEFMRQGVESTLRKNRVELFRGRGTLSGKGQVRVGGTTLNYKKLILAAGAEWIPPDFPGAHLEGVVNSDYFLEARTLPARVLLYGESPWLIQIAQFLHRYGSQVLLGTPHKALLHKESKTIGARLTAVLKNEEIGLTTQMVIQGLQKKKSGLHCHLKVKGKDETAVVDRVVTLPRRAALKDLGLEGIGIEAGAGCIAVNERMETAVKGVFAIGDIAAPEERHYSHLAAAPDRNLTLTKFMHRGVAHQYLA